MTHKSLKDFTDQQLYGIVCNNEFEELSKLSGVCSEILRRMIEREYNLDMSNEFINGNKSKPSIAEEF